MKKSISTHHVSNNAGYNANDNASYNGLNGLDKQKRPNFHHQAITRYPLMPTWRVYRISYWSPLQGPRSDTPKEAIK